MKQASEEVRNTPRSAIVSWYNGDCDVSEQRTEKQKETEKQKGYNRMRKNRRTSILMLVMTMSVLLILAACGGDEATEPSPTTTPESPQVAENPTAIVVTATPPPMTDTPNIIVVTATPPPPTATPTDTPLPTDTPTSTSTPTPTPDLIEQKVLNEVGLGWSVAANSDLNGDNKPEIVAYSAANISPAVSVEGYTLAVNELVVAQEGAGDTVRFMLRVSPQGVVADGASLLSFPSPAAALLIARSGSQISVIPLNSEGKGYVKGGVFFWDTAAQQYILTGEVEVPGELTPPTATAEPTATVELTETPAEAQTPAAETPTGTEEPYP